MIKIYHIVAMSENRVIGKDGDIPWHIPEDQQRFKEITLGHPVLMGRKTFQSLPCILSNRLNLVLSNHDAVSQGEHTIHQHEDIRSIGGGRVSLESNIVDAVRLCRDRNLHEIYVIGGESVYRQTMRHADEIRMTLVHDEIEGGDAFYPEIDSSKWVQSSTSPHPDYSYIDYSRCHQESDLSEEGFNLNFDREPYYNVNIRS